MPSINEMFPSRFIKYKDLDPGRTYELTIKGVTLDRAAVGGGGFGQAKAQAELLWLIHFHEVPKPLPLKQKRAKVLAGLFGTEMTEQWVGKRVAIYRGTWVNGGESGEGIMIDDRPIMQLSPGSPIPGTNALGSISPHKIPKANMDRFRATLSDKGKVWDDFLRWLNGKDKALFAELWGVDFDQITTSAVGVMKAYLDELHGGAGPATAASLGEVIDRRTGEVSQVPTVPRPAPTLQAESKPPTASVPTANFGNLPPAPTEINPDDIPF